MDYIDGFIAAVPTANRDKYLQHAEAYAEVFKECGATHCRDDSPNRHATAHAQASKHPVIASAEPGERWLYCYPDEASAEY